MMAVKKTLRSAGGWLEKVGQILITPAAILPLAGLLMMAGDLFGRLGFSPASALTATGSAILAQFPLLVAVCLAYGLANGKPGAAALSGVISYLVLTQAGRSIFILLLGDAAMPPFNMGLLAGVLAGLIAVGFHNRFRDLALPEWLAFFSGCRMTALMTAVAALLLGAGCGALWTLIQSGLISAADSMAYYGAGGAFAYGFLNRLLLPFGLHNVLNQEIWFNFGEFTSRSGQYVTGDLNRFLAGDPTAGRLISGFFPMMIFGVPAIALCFAVTARVQNRTRLILLLAINAVVSLVSGVAEPLEYLILFVSPLLYVIYALLFGLSLLISYQLQVLIGFEFSTGLSDYLANWTRAALPERVWQIGIVMAILSFAATYFVVMLLHVRAPGHDRPEAEDDDAAVLAVIGDLPSEPETADVTEPAAEESSQAPEKEGYTAEAAASAEETMQETEIVETPETPAAEAPESLTQMTMDQVAETVTDTKAELAQSEQKPKTNRRSKPKNNKPE